MAPPPRSLASNRLRLTVAYDGRPFDGWQSQARGNTIQDHLETAFSRLCGGQRIPVHGSAAPTPGCTRSARWRTPTCRTAAVTIQRVGAGRSTPTCPPKSG